MFDVLGCDGCSWSDGGGGRGDVTRNSWGEVSESVMDLGVYEDLTRSAIRLVKNGEFYARRSQPASRKFSLVSGPVIFFGPSPKVSTEFTHYHV